MEKQEFIQKFALEGEFINVCEYGNGHINRTYLVETEENGTREKYIFQQINTDVFRNVDQLMENISNVTSFLKKKIEQQGGNPKRETMQIIPTKDGKSYYKTDNACFRMYRFITDAISLDMVRSPRDFYESAVAFGNFQALLSDYPAQTLHETIPDFHNTVKRFETFCKAVDADVCRRAALVGPEIDFFMNRKNDFSLLTDLLAKGELPLRVTHNDTKLNNIMIDLETGTGICVIDLDTVMPGLSLYDFGDSIRFGACTAVEDETDLSKVSLDLELYELYVQGYLKGCRGSLTPRELSLLPEGARLMTLECGMRFLTDYLSGDTYFRIHRENHNLDRCRTQMTLAADMERKWTKMHEIVKAQTK